MGDGLTQDDLQREATHAAAVAMRNWFFTEGLNRKPCGALNITELESAVTAGISGWLRARSEQERQRETQTALSKGAAILS